MPWKTSFLAVVLAVFASSTARAIDFGLLLPWHACWPDCIQKTCSDDYRAKAIPCVPRIDCFGCDDYTRKCEPRVNRLCFFGCDDYRPKCEPVIRCDPRSDLKCVPTEPARCLCGCGQSVSAHHQRTSKR
jgi:hypothetical protein